MFVLDADLSSRQRAEAVREARAMLLDEEPTVVDPVELSPIIRFAVWCRDGGRCVDCGATDDVRWDEILPPENGGSRTAANVELRCGTCHERRLHNEVRARVSRARVGAAAGL